MGEIVTDYAQLAAFSVSMGLIGLGVGMLDRLLELIRL